MAKQTPTTEIAEVKKGALVAPDFIDAADFGAGFESADKDSYAIPFLTILQKMSPQVDDDSPKHMPGAKAGMILNTVTGKLYDVREKPLTIVQAAYKRSFIRWAQRDEGGGFRGECSPEAMDAIIADGDVENVDGKLLVKDADGKVDPKKSEYWMDTRAHYVIVIDPDTEETMPAILSLASTQTRPSKMLMTSLANKRVDTPQGKKMPPSFANVIKFTTNTQTNDKGNWAGAAFTLDGLVTDRDLFEIAKEFHKSIADGTAKADYSKVDGASAGVDDTPKQAEGF